jgi:hypothetical protein
MSGEVRLTLNPASWRRRSLAGKRYRYLVIDAHYEQLRREGSVRSTAVLWVVGIVEDGYREHLGLWTGSAEQVEAVPRPIARLAARGNRIPPVAMRAAEHIERLCAAHDVRWRPIAETAAHQSGVSWATGNEAAPTGQAARGRWPRATSDSAVASPKAPGRSRAC